jgi:hypothetical protein
MESLLFTQPQTAQMSSRAHSVIAFAHLTYSVSAADLQAEIQQLLQQAWVDHVNKQDYQGGWDVLPLRCQHQHLNAHPVLQGFAIAEGDEWEDLPVLAFCPIISAVLASLKCPVKSVRLMRLKAGAEIKPHRDHKLGIEHGEARLHMPIHTSDKVIFTVNDLRVPMAAGELWYINTDLIHAVINNGDQDRINLVIDCAANDWLREQIQQGSAI